LQLKFLSLFSTRIIVSFKKKENIVKTNYSFNSKINLNCKNIKIKITIITKIKINNIRFSNYR